jgi:hypothetical protein
MKWRSINRVRFVTFAHGCLYLSSFLLSDFNAEYLSVSRKSQRNSRGSEPELALVRDRSSTHTHIEAHVSSTGASAVPPRLVATSGI